jgi:homoserine O-acetyltransferase
MGAGLQPTREGDLTFADDAPFRLESGGALQPVTIRYAMYGELNAARDNAVLVCHALSGSARVADWWPEMFTAQSATNGSAPGAVFDLSRDCVICANILGSCYGSTGPTSIDSATGKSYGPAFPVVHIRDIVRTQKLLLDSLGIEHLRTVIGASIGGMEALQWSVDYPDRVGHCIAIGTAPLSAMGLALNHLQRQAILLDPKFNDGHYDPEQQPKRGLALARAIAMCSYKSAELFGERYSRKPNRNGEDPLRSLHERFDVAGYLDYQGEKFVQRFDANSYLVITKLMDTFDLARGYASEQEALRRIRAHVSLIGISSDWLFPPEDVRALAERLRAAGVESDYTEFESAHGHDGFLAEMEPIAAVVNGRVNARTALATRL